MLSLSSSPLFFLPIFSQYLPFYPFLPISPFPHFLVSSSSTNLHNFPPFPPFYCQPPESGSIMFVHNWNIPLPSPPNCHNKWVSARNMSEKAIHKAIFSAIQLENNSNHTYSTTEAHNILITESESNPAFWHAPTYKHFNPLVSWVCESGYSCANIGVSVKVRMRVRLCMCRHPREKRECVCLCETEFVSERQREYVFVRESESICVCV